MPLSSPLPSQIHCADGLAVCQGLASGSVDLIYVDPPFATGVAKKLRGNAYDDPKAGYLDWIRPRLIEMHRVLAPKGSLFLHLDFRATHYVKIELDRIFGSDQFVNEIIWCYSVGGKSRRSFGRKHDSILWYGRTLDYAFYPDAVRVPRKAGSHMKVEQDGAGLVQVKRDRKTGRLYKYPVSLGKIPEDYWTDIETLNRGDHERTGWPTQKPEALLGRIILAASAPGDLVADFCAGSGTTAAVAQRLGRRFLAVDRSADAGAIIKKRLGA